MSDDVVVRGRWIDGISAQVADTARKVKSEFSLLNVASVALGSIGAIGLTQAFGALASTLKESAAATIEQERADRLLENALRSQGKLTQERFDALKDYASELQRTSAFTDEQVQQAQALALALGVNTDRITELTDAAAVLSVSLGTDLSSAMRTLVKGEIGGMEGALKRLIGDFDDFGEAIEKLAAKRGSIVDLQLGPKEREAHDLKVQIDELREATGGAGLMFENMGLRTNVAILGMVESAQQLKDIMDEIGGIGDIHIGAVKGSSSLIQVDNPPDLSIVDLEEWRKRQKTKVGEQTYTPDPNALALDQITGTAPTKDAAQKLMADWKKQQAEYESDRKDFVDDLIRDRQEWVEEFTRLMGYEPKMPAVTIGADGKPVQGPGYRNLEDMGVGAQQDFERAQAVQAYRGTIANQNAEDYMGGFSDAPQIIDATGEAIDEMTAVIGEAQQWTEAYIKTKERESGVLKMAENVSGAVADSFQENFDDVLEGTKSFFEGLGSIFAAGLSQIIEDALQQLQGNGSGNFLGSAFQWVSDRFGGGDDGASIDGGGVLESSIRNSFGTEPAYAGGAAPPSSGAPVYNVNFYAGGNSTAAAGAMAQATPTVPIGALGQDFDEILEGYIIPRVLKSVGQHMQRGR